MSRAVRLINPPEINTSGRSELRGDIPAVKSSFTVDLLRKQLESRSDMSRPDLPILQQRRNALAKNPTRAESLLCQRLLEEKVRFGFQVIVPPYIVDFLIPKRMLVIEVDGSSHKNKKEYDERRTRYLEARGFRVVRILNSEVATWSLKTIRKYCEIPGAHGLVSQIVKYYDEQGIMPVSTRGKTKLMKIRPRKRKKKRKRKLHYSKLLAEVHAQWMSV